MLPGKNTESNKPEKFRTDASEIWMGEDGFVWSEIFQDLDTKDMEQAYEVFSKMGFGPGKKKGLHLITGSRVYSLSKAAREYVKKHAPDYITASALVTNSLAMRFLVELFNTFQRNKVPFKTFSNVESAAEWLNEFRE